MKLKPLLITLFLLLSTGCVMGDLVGGNIVRDEVLLTASDLDYLELRTISADVEVRVAEVEAVAVSLCGQIRINSGSPDANLKLAVNQMGNRVVIEPKIVGNVDSYSGHLKMVVLVPEGVYPEIFIDTASGSADIRNYPGDIRFDSSSGNFSYRQQGMFVHNVSAKTRSGSINVWLPRNSSYYATGKTVISTARAAGIISDDPRSFSGRVGTGEPCGMINLETSSGSIYVRDI
jgi:hypothetical protein